MKYTLLFLLLASTLHAQKSETEAMSKKNSFGITLSGQELSLIPSLNDAPTLGVEYRRFLSDKAELKLSFEYQHSKFDLVDDSYAISLGLNRYLYQHAKWGVYGGAELSYIRSAFLEFDNMTDPLSWPSLQANELNLNVLFGIEYNPTSRVGLFLEPRLMSTNISANSDRKNFPVHNFSFLKETKIGVKYRF